MENYTIVKIKALNYSKFDDLIYWRLNQQERLNGEFAVSDEEMEGIVETLENPNLHMYAAQIDNKFVGWISIVYIPKVGRWKNFGHLFVDELWVEPSFRNHGIASKLLQTVDEITEEFNVDGCRLYVSTSNLNATRLYEKHGYINKAEAYFMEK